MVLGLGIDVVQVERMRAWMDKPELLERFFHEIELANAKKRGDASILSLAARFAAKEAYGKALGTGLRGFGLKEVRVNNNEMGKPEIELTGGALKALSKIDGKRVLLSLTHERDNAIAVVLIEG